MCERGADAPSWRSSKLRVPERDAKPLPFTWVERAYRVKLVP